MAAKGTKKEQAKTLFCQGLTIAKVAERVGIDPATFHRWRAEALAAGDDWKKLKADLKAKAPPPKPNLITFERPRGDKKSPTPKAPIVAAEDMDLVAIVNGAIASVAALLPTADNLQGVGGAASGLATLVRLKLELENEEDGLQRVMEKYKSPRELAAKLRELGWGRETA
jgi:hypothetical protein